MSPTLWIILLLVIGALLLVGELLLPTQGVLGIFGGAAILGAVAVAFTINQWLGLGLLVALVAASPFVATAVVNIWPRTPLGKKIVLTPPESRVERPAVTIGQGGRAVSELRPTGEIEFVIDGLRSRVEARSDHGIIRAGSAVRVVGHIDGVVVVRHEPEIKLATEAQSSQRKEI
jgi:membrane-bound ClpP family serine protease